MKYEVEQKHRIEDLDQFLQTLATRGVEIGPAEQHADSYYNHPMRDYAETDEALRIRSIGEANFITYKGPRIDKTSKTRQELEISVHSGIEGAMQYTELFDALKFKRVATVAKSRRPN